MWIDHEERGEVARAGACRRSPHAPAIRLAGVDPLLLLKLTLTPLLITAASLTGRRWGPAVGGWLVGLPFTSGPVSLFLALERGPHFASEAASGSIAGVLAAIAFAGAYVGTAGWGWPAALATGSALFAAAAGVVRLLPPSSDLPLPLFCIFGAAILALVAGLRLTPARRQVAYAVRAPRWDLPARALVATGVVLLITTLAPVLGPQLSGFVTTYPVYAGVLAVFAHRQHGPVAGQQVLRGLLYGLFAFAAFFLVIAVAIERWGIAQAFVGAIAAALVTQSLTLRAMRAGRRGLFDEGGHSGGFDFGGPGEQDDRAG